MRDLCRTILALIFVFFTLMSLLSVNPNWDKTLPPITDDQSRVSELGLRFAFHK